MNEGYRLTVVTPPSGLAVSLATLKEAIHLVGDDENATLTRYLYVATELVSRYLRRTLMSTTYLFGIDAWREPLRLPRAPLASVTSVTYLDTDDAAQTWAASNYIVDTAREPGEITRAYGVSFPSLGHPTAAQPSLVVVRYVAGYASAAAIPYDIQEAIVRAATTLYETRGEMRVLPDYVRCLLGNHVREF